MVSINWNMRNGGMLCQRRIRQIVCVMIRNGG